jgi:antitoxin (DNA-binding transcriptional repressor) of toxin-antitoxin stability system
MPTVTLQETRATLPDSIHRARPGQAVVMTEHDRPIARLVSELPAAKSGLRPPPGFGKGYITILSDDDEHLKDFVEYMP